MSRLILLLICCICSFKTSIALDVSWIPTDPDGPLPLSAKYRDSLRKLCSLMKIGGPLPPELNEKKHVLNKMCLKLDAGDSNIASVDKFRNMFSVATVRRVVIAGFVSLVTKYLIWDKRRGIRKYLNSIPKKFSSAGKGDISNTLTDVQIAREARLKRFQKESAAETVVHLGPTDLAEED
jgi:hypothetical protein